MKQFKFLIMIFMLVLLPGAGFNTMVTAQEIRSAAALGFSPDGILFVGDNVGGAIYAFDMGKGTAPANPTSTVRVVSSIFTIKICSSLHYIL